MGAGDGFAAAAARWAACSRVPGGLPGRHPHGGGRRRVCCGLSEVGGLYCPYTRPSANPPCREAARQERRGRFQAARQAEVQQKVAAARVGAPLRPRDGAVLLERRRGQVPSPAALPPLSALLLPSGAPLRGRRRPNRSTGWRRPRRCPQLAPVSNPPASLAPPPLPRRRRRPTGWRSSRRCLHPTPASNPLPSLILPRSATAPLQAAEADRLAQLKALPAPHPSQQSPSLSFLAPPPLPRRRRRQTRWRSSRRCWRRGPSRSPSARRSSGDRVQRRRRRRGRCLAAQRSAEPHPRTALQPAQQRGWPRRQQHRFAVPCARQQRCYMHGRGDHRTERVQRFSQAREKADSFV